MNSNFLCKVYGVRGYRVTGKCHKDNKTILKIERKHVKICCRHCGNIGISLDGSRIRDILCVPFGLRKTLLRVRIRRYRCPKCGHVCQESVPFVTGNRHYSHRFAQYAAVLLKTCTIKSVATLLSVSWDTVKRIHKEYLRRRYTPVSLKGVRNIGIDEFSIMRGVEFRTIVVDIDTGRIIHVGMGARRRRPAAVLGTRQEAWRHDTLRGHGPVAGICRLCTGKRPAGHTRVRPFPRCQTHERRTR